MTHLIDFPVPSFYRFTNKNTVEDVFVGFVKGTGIVVYSVGDKVGFYIEPNYGSVVTTKDFDRHLFIERTFTADVKNAQFLADWGKDQRQEEDLSRWAQR
jgi:hypothetical protein